MVRLIPIEQRGKIVWVEDAPGHCPAGHEGMASKWGAVPDGRLRRRGVGRRARASEVSSYGVVMLKTNPIRRCHVGAWLHNAATGESRALRRWVAVCPDCGETLQATGPTFYSLGTRASRKTAKDALYRHQQKEHRPGSVGR